MSATILDPTALPQAEEQQIEALRAFLRREREVRLSGKSGEASMQLPNSAAALLLEVLKCMGEGNAVSIVPLARDLTTQQAAAMLGVSRPFLVKLLDSGKLPHHLAGTHRRIYLKDLLAYKDRRDRERHDALDKMGLDAERAGLYDKVLLPDE